MNAKAPTLLPDKPAQENPETVALDVRNCSACGGNHSVVFRKLEPPEGKWILTGTCPFLGTELLASGVEPESLQATRLMIGLSKESR